MAPCCNAMPIRRGRQLPSRRPSLAGPAALLLAMLLLAGCAPLTESVVALDGASPGDPASVATLAIDPAHPLLLRGVDGQAVTTSQVPNALRSWSFLLPPGSHRLWLSTVPYGHPLLPQKIGCYVIDARLDAGLRYVLRYDPGAESALLVREGSADPAVGGRLVDRPFVFERACRFE